VLKTRKLGSYAISDKELKIAAPVVSSSAVTEEKPNVNTGFYSAADWIDPTKGGYLATDQVKLKDGLLKANDDGILAAAPADVAQGTTVYYELDYVLSRTDMGKVKVKADWKVGDNMMTDVKVEYKKIDPNPLAVGDEYYSYVIALYTTKIDDLKDLDYVGTLTVYKTSVNNYYDKKDINFDNLYLGTPVLLTALPNGTVASSTKLVKFTDLEEETIAFDGVGEFEIDLSNQGNLYLGFSTKANTTVIDQYPEANLEFITFKGSPAFNKTGLFYMYADEGSFLYELVDGKLVAKNAVYDDDYGALKFAAKKLGAYVISDVELKLAAEATPEKPVVNTGAAVSAVAIAAMAAAAAVALKK